MSRAAGVVGIMLSSLLGVACGGVHPPSEALPPDGGADASSGPEWPENWPPEEWPDEAIDPGEEPDGGVAFDGGGSDGSVPEADGGGIPDGSSPADGGADGGTPDASIPGDAGSLPPRTAYRMAFVLVAHDAGEIGPDMISRIEAVKADFPAAFSLATGGRATMDTSSPVAVVYVPATYRSNHTIVTKEFYRTHPDVYDFVSIYSAYDGGLSMSHTPLRNDISGIGMSLRDLSAQYGSASVLLGVNYLGHFLFSTSFSDAVKTGALHGLLHETGHQWCCYVGDRFTGTGDAGVELEIIQRGFHFYRGLEAGHATGDPMDSDHWVPNGDGTYRRENAPGLKRYHAFQIYFMGLLPASEYSVQHPLYNAGVVGVSFDPTRAVPYKQVSVNDIIAVEGPWRRQ